MRNFTRKTQQLIVVALACVVVQACGDLGISGMFPPPTVQPEGDIEPNNSKATASAISPNATFNGTVTEFYDDVDWLKIHFTVPGTLAVQVTNMNTGAAGFDLQVVTGDSVVVRHEIRTPSVTGSIDTIGAVNVSAGDVWLRLSRTSFGFSYRINAVYTPGGVLTATR